MSLRKNLSLSESGQQFWHFQLCGPDPFSSPLSSIMARQPVTRESNSMHEKTLLVSPVRRLAFAQERQRCVIQVTFVPSGNTVWPGLSVRHRYRVIDFSTPFSFPFRTFITDRQYFLLSTSPAFYHQTGSHHVHVNHTTYPCRNA